MAKKKTVKHPIEKKSTRNLSAGIQNGSLSTRISANSKSSEIFFYLNGQEVRPTAEEAFMMTADWLRKRKGMPGTKIVCAEGDCGACTVLIADPRKESLDFVPINSCVYLVGQLHGKSVVTIEGISNGSILSPVQNAMMKCHGSQCGYCTPGFVMALTGLLESRKMDNIPAAQKRKVCTNYLTGNLCRCTGYAPILDAACNMTDDSNYELKHRYLNEKIITTLKSNIWKTNQMGDKHGPTWYSPNQLEDALKFLKNQKSSVKILGSTTDLGVLYNKGKSQPNAFLSLQNIKALHASKVTPKQVQIGAQVSLESVRGAMKNIDSEFVNLLNIFASPQIKNVATLIGNVANGSPIGDTIPYLLVRNAIVYTSGISQGKIRERKIPLDKFYIGYKTSALESQELITKITFDRPKANNFVRHYKISTRKDLDISTMSMAISLDCEFSGHQFTIKQPRIAIGGMGPTAARIYSVEQKWEHQILTKTTILDLTHETACSINLELSPLSDHRGSADYRRALITNFFSKFASEFSQFLESMGVP
ncbi:MAG: FAD binding domain-containing protein [Proteobacteria bacterium]|nr:FAD binding domain-containing protein [Pseudomonadota bacterium]